ncbi:MAG: PKD domain-containing protein [Bacteroidota bacterium]
MLTNKAITQLNLKLFLLGMVMVFCTKLNAQSPIAAFNNSVSIGCAPVNVQFTNASQNAISYSWSFGNGNSSTLVSPSNVYLNAGSYTVTLTATSANGQVNSTSKTITVVATPIANFSVQTTSGCQSSQVFSFQNSSMNYDSCLWDFGDGTTSSVTSPQHIYNIPGVFNVTLIAFNKQYGCSNSKTVNSLITVNPKPVISFFVNDSITCDSAKIFQFTGVATNVTSWLWDFGDGTTSTLQNPTHVYHDTGYFSISVTTQSNNACPGTLTKNNFIHIKYNPKPIISTSLFSGCQPLYVTMSVPYNPSFSYQWDFGDSSGLVNTFITYHTFHNAGVYNPTITVNYNNGCTNASSLNNLTVYPKPLTNYTISNYVGCAPLYVNFINNTPGSNNTYLWDFGDGNSSTQQNPIYAYVNAGSYHVSLTVTSANGCSYGYPLSGSVIVYSPEANFTPDVTTGCPPLTVNFNNYSTAASSYLWVFGDGTTSTLQHPSHVYTNVGVYTPKLIVYSGTGCSDTLMYPTPINVSYPSVNYVSPAPIIGCAPFSANFADNSASSQWLWNFGDGTTSTLSNPQHTYNDSGTYIVSLTTWGVNGGCERTISNFQTFIIDESQPGFTYTVSPCPPYTVQFTDTSHNAVAWHWSFSDGGNANVQNPVHVFPGLGNFNVSLTTTTANGCPTNVSISNAVHITGLGANPSMVCTDSVPPFNVLFHANSTNATWWLWDFGDGTTSSLENPTHIYTTNTSYNLSLIVGNDSCSYSLSFPNTTLGHGSSTGGSLGGGGVVVVPQEVHCAPYKVKFYSPLSTGASWLWNFGDGFTSSDPSPEHTYVDSGTFIPSVIITGINGVNDTMYYPIPYYVVKPVTDFTINTTNLCNGVVVTASTTSAANSYHWNFGNGLTYTSPTASSNYPLTNASYLISLNITDTNQCNSYVAKSFQVNATSPISSNVRRTCANTDVTFNAGAVNYQNYFWNFGDGNYSTLKDPVHAYVNAGLFPVSLIVVDVNGCSDTFNLAYQIEVFNPKANFSYTSSTNCSTISVHLSDSSTGNTSWKWIFGDGTISTNVTTFKAFYNPGYYDITLVAYDNICTDTMTVHNAIYVSRPKANFTYTQSSVCLPITASFQDLSIDAAKWHWDFGDGTTDSVQNPIHVFTTKPVNPITLVINDVNGCQKDTTKQNIEITYADFGFSSTGNCNPVTVSFADSSINPISWLWSFGDGTSSTDSNPTHTYNSNGSYNITLTVQSAEGCLSTIQLDSLINVGQTNADFHADSTDGCLPFLVGFTDQSSNVIAWQWDFGDGSSSSNQNPNHVYTLPGKYTVRLITQNAFGCSDTIVKNELINVRGAVPNFTLSATNGCAPVVISFSNTSTGAISYSWNFGDGSTDSSTNANHVYANQGTYTVSLYAYDTTGCSTLYSYPNPILIGNSPILNYTISSSVGCSPFTLTINDYNTIADSLVWDMGNGVKITGAHPIYTYSNAGNYIIKLLAYNHGGCTDSLTYSDTIKVYQTPSAAFSSNIQIGCNPLPIQFSNTSTNLVNPVYLWDFGNVDSSSLSNPNYTYDNSGVYSPSLIITNEGGCSDTFNLGNNITVYDKNPPIPTAISYVTVENNTTVRVTWPVGNEPDITHYIIYRLNPITNRYDSIANVLQQSNSFITYLDANLNTLQNTYTYKVQAVDYCGSYQPLSNLVAHKTIELSASGGFMKNDLSWNEYQGCDFSHYEIYRKENNSSSLVYLTTVQKSITHFSDTTAFCQGEYTYQIKAVSICQDARFDSWSDTARVITNSDLNKQFVDVTRTTVVNDQYTLTEWLAPAYRSDLVVNYNVYRSVDQVNYNHIATVPSQLLSYEDYNVNVDAQNYYYKIEVVNTCNMNTEQGRIGSSVLLDVYETDITNILKWTKYTDWDAGVEKYVVEKLNANGIWEQIKVVSGAITEWEEK